MHPIIAVSNLSKTYASGFEALKNIDLEIRQGEIFALLGPNGAGKTTLISIICGLVNPTAGKVTVDGHDIIEDYRAARSLILVEDKTTLIKKLGRRQLMFHLQTPLTELPTALSRWELALKDGGYEIEYSFDASQENTGIPELLRELTELGISIKDLSTAESSLEDIFVRLLDGGKDKGAA